MPSGNKKQLTPEEIAVSLKAWVAQLPLPKSKLASGTSTITPGFRNIWRNTSVREYPQTTTREALRRRNYRLVSENGFGEGTRSHQRIFAMILHS